jgi:hypothetical protein
MRLQLPHKFSRFEATQRVKAALDEARTKVADKVSIEKEEWQGDTLHFAFTAEGQHISGTLEVQDAQYLIDAKLPLMLRLFEGKIQKAIEEQAKQLLK